MRSAIRYEGHIVCVTHGSADAVQTLGYVGVGKAENEGDTEDGWSEETITPCGTPEEEQHEYGAVDGTDEAEVDGQNESLERKSSNNYELVGSLRSGGVLMAYKDWMVSP